MAKPTPESVEQKRERALRLAPLKDLPAWNELRAIVEERKTFHWARLAKDIALGPTMPPVDQRKLDWLSGYVAGMEDLLERPDLAEISFASAFERFERAELAAKEGAT